jgi:hypothetical protein
VATVFNNTYGTERLNPETAEPYEHMKIRCLKTGFPVETITGQRRAKVGGALPKPFGLS